MPFDPGSSFDMEIPDGIDFSIGGRLSMTTRPMKNEIHVVLSVMKG
jgi:hypothetical protein